MRSLLKLGIALAILTLSTMAFAGSIGGLAYTGGRGANRITVVAELFGTYEGAGDWLITDMRGEFFIGLHPYAITGMVPLGTDPNYAYDNLFTDNKPQVDSTGGLLFSISNGAHENLWFNDGSGDQWTNGARGYMISTGENPYVTIPVKGAGFICATPTPEPSTLLTMGSGLLGLAGLARKRLFS